MNDLNPTSTAGTAGATGPSATTMALGATATALALTALQVRLNAERAEREYPPLGAFVSAGGVRLHRLEYGSDGPPVVLLHGNGTMAEDFASSGVVELLGPDHRLVLFDRPGFGHSERPRDQIWTAEAQAAALRAAFARLGLERPIVVGHSWRTLVALALALNHPEAVRGLVLASGYYFPTARADVAALSPPAIPVLGDVLRYTVSPVVGGLIAPKVIARMFQPAPVSSRFAAAVPVPLMLRPWQLRAAAAETGMMIPTAARLAARYGELRLPVALVTGADDQIVDVGRHAERMHRELSGSRLIVVPGLGHMVHHGAPWAVRDAVVWVATAAPRLEAPAGPALPEAA